MNNKEIVILVGSGRSGTTWLGSLLDSYEHVEYYYETTFFPELTIGDTDFYRIKYPLTFWLKNKIVGIKKLERNILQKLLVWNIKQNTIRKSLRLNHSLIFDKQDIHIDLFKEVVLIDVALDLERLFEKYQNKIKLVHLVRNPLSYISSELRQQEKHIQSAKKHFKNRLETLLKENRLEKYHPLMRYCLGKGFIAHLTALWWVGNDMMLNQKKIPSQLITYEEFCASPEKKLKDIFGFLGWEFGEQTKQHLLSTTKVDKQEKGEWSLQKDSKFTLNRWKNELNKDDYDLVMDILKDCELLSLWSKKTFEY